MDPLPPPQAPPITHALSPALYLQPPNPHLPCPDPPPTPPRAQPPYALHPAPRLPTAPHGSCLPLDARLMHVAKPLFKPPPAHLMTASTRFSNFLAMYPLASRAWMRNQAQGSAGRQAGRQRLTSPSPAQEHASLCARPAAGAGARRPRMAMQRATSSCWGPKP